MWRQLFFSHSSVSLCRQIKLYLGDNIVCMSTKASDKQAGSSLVQPFQCQWFSLTAPNQVCKKSSLTLLELLQSVILRSLWVAIWRVWIWERLMWATQSDLCWLRCLTLHFKSIFGPTQNVFLLRKPNTSQWKQFQNHWQGRSIPFHFFRNKLQNHIAAILQNEGRGERMKGRKQQSADLSTLWL